MPTVRVFDPPMCCSTGVCGPSVDPELARFTADLDWLKKQGVQVERYNLSQQPGAFASNAVVKDALTARGNDCLPLVVVDERIAVEGAYPSRDTLAALAGVVVRKLEAAPAAERLLRPEHQGAVTRAARAAAEGVDELRRPRSASPLLHRQGRRRQDVGRLRDGAGACGARSSGAPREHRPCVEPRRGPRDGARCGADAGHRRGEPLRA